MAQTDVMVNLVLQVFLGIVDLKGQMDPLEYLEMQETVD
jgi:hypothetical protein